MSQAAVRQQVSSLLGTDIPADAISAEEADYLEKNLHRIGSVQEIWAAMDDEWERQGASFAAAHDVAMGRFYASPVWLLNGIFTEIDSTSRVHRDAIAAFVAKRQPSFVVDYGGGFGALARRIAAGAREARVMVVEPWPHSLALSLASAYRNLSYHANLPHDADVVVAEDVLEHVTDPLELFGRLLGSTRRGGVVIAANCFLPVIRCHYPGAFHLHFTFSCIVSRLGCRFEGCIPEADHAQVFLRTGAKSDWRAARRLERASRMAYPVLRLAQSAKRRFLHTASRSFS